MSEEQEALKMADEIEKSKSKEKHYDCVELGFISLAKAYRRLEAKLKEAERDVSSLKTANEEAGKTIDRQAEAIERLNPRYIHGSS
jgi:chromosome segregation ATPase